MLDKLKNIIINGSEFLPIFEGGKGIGLTTGLTAGSFAKCGAIGTFSGVNTDEVDDNGEIIPFIFKAKNRLERHLESLEHTVKGMLSQAKRARDISSDKGRIHANVLWEMGGTEYILNEFLSKAKGLVQGIVCGAGMPYKLGEIAAKYNVNYFPIVSSMRTFRALWKRSFNKTKEWLGGIVYECPWRAGGHNGLTNAENPFEPQDQYPRIVELRKFMNEVGLNDTPIIVAGGIWNIKENERYLNNPEVGNVAFQFGTRPLVTQESPASNQLKQELLHLKKDDVLTNTFSPTGFYSSAVKNDFLNNLVNRSERQIMFSVEKTNECNTEIIEPKTSKKFFIANYDLNNVNTWMNNGFNRIVQTPDNTILFMSDLELLDAKEDMKNCCGCLSQCRFSTWSQYEKENNYTTGKLPDYRSFCIQKALQYAKSGTDPKQELHFAGSIAYRFSEDPMYKNGYIPTIAELIEALIDGK